ncbi:MAG: hypothetical protein ABIP75_17395 [Pyrinomonadaceae bacterium]
MSFLRFVGRSRVYGSLLCALLILILTGGAEVAWAQTKDTTVNQLTELAGLRTCFVVSDRLDKRTTLIKEMNKQNPEWQVIESAADAEFFLETRVISVETEVDATRPITTSELVVYVKRDGRRVIVWQEEERDADTIRSNESNLVRHLVKALKWVNTK